MSSYFGLQVLFLYFRTSHFSVSIPHFGWTLILRPINQSIRQTLFYCVFVCVVWRVQQDVVAPRKKRPPSHQLTSVKWVAVTSSKRAQCIEIGLLPVIQTDGQAECVKSLNVISRSYCAQCDQLFQFSSVQLQNLCFTRSYEGCADA